MQNTAMETPEKRKRPLGVTIMAVLLGIQGLVELVIAALAIGALVALGSHISASGHTTTGTVLDVLGWVLGAIPLVLGVVTLILAFGLWALKRWAFWATAFFSAIFLLRQVVEFIRPHDHIAWIIVGMIIPVVILLYLFVDPHVRQAFRI